MPPADARRIEPTDGDREKVAPLRFHCETPDGPWWCEDDSMPGWSGTAATLAECMMLHREAKVVMPLLAELGAVRCH